MRGSGCGFDLVLACLPIPRQQFIDPFRRIIREFREDIGKPGLRIDVIELAGFDQCIDGGCPVGSRVRARKSPIRPAGGYTPDSALGSIVAKAYAPIIKKAGEGGPSAQAVVDRLGNLTFRRDAIALIAQPGFERLNERLCLLLAHGEPLLWRAAVDRTLDLEEFADAAHGLAGNRRFRQLGEIEKLFSPVAPTCGFNDRRRSSPRLVELIEARKSIGLHDPSPSGKMGARIITGPAAGVIEERRRRSLAGKGPVITDITLR